MKKKLAAILLIVIGIVAVVYFEKPTVLFPKEQEVYSGTIEATLIPIQTETSGKITKLFIKEGQTVEINKVIVNLDDTAEKIALNTSENQLKQAENKLADLVGGTRAQEIRRLQANVSQAQAGLEQIKTNAEQLEAFNKRDLENLNYEANLLKETEGLFKEGAVTQRDYEAQQHKYNLAKTQYESSKAQLEGISAQYKSNSAQLASTKANLDLAMEGYTQPTILAQKAAVEVAREAVKLAQFNLSKTTIKTPASGVIQYKHVEIGQVVNPGGKIATILDPKDLWVKVYVPEGRLDKVKIGQTVEISVDAYQDKIFKGKVVNISENAEFTPKNVQTKEERTTIVFAVKVQITNGFGQLKSGMPADVSFK